MTTSPPETKTGLRLGPATLAATGCLVAVLAAGLPVRAAESDRVLAKVNGSEIHASDVALAAPTMGCVPSTSWGCRCWWRPRSASRCWCSRSTASTTPG